MRKLVSHLQLDQIIETNESRLVSRGQCGTDWLHIKNQLDQGKTPHHEYGNFGYIYFNKIDRTEIAVTDHLASFPIFYSDEYISFDFISIKNRLPPSYNAVVAREIELLGGQSFSPQTLHSHILRLPPGHQLSGSKLTEWFSIDHISPELHDPAVFKETLEKKMRQVLQNKFALLLSGGCDSVCLAAVARAVNQDASCYHVYSPLSSLSEKNHVQEIAREMNLDVHWFEVPISGDIVSEISDLQYSLWIENPFSAKYLCALQARSQGYAGLITGEIGDQLFGGPKNPLILKAATQYDLSHEKIAEIWINQAFNYSRKKNVALSAALTARLEEPHFAEAFYKLRAQISLELEKMESLPLEERLLRLNFKVKGPYRMYAYSQSDLLWEHPFASLEVARAALALRTDIKTGGLRNGKKIYMDLWNSYISARPWKVAKFGLGIPAKSKFEPWEMSL